MNKSQLADELATRIGITKTLASEAINALFDTETGLITETIRTGEKVALQGFGTFVVKTRAARTATNPATGAKIQVPAKNTVKFTAGKNLRETIAG